MLVLYKRWVAAAGSTAAATEGAGPGEWVTVCDYVRFWSPASTSAAFHHHAMHVVAQHLKGEDGSNAKVPKLKRLLLWTDGHSSTYKGFPNFGRMGHWPLKKPTSALEAKVLTVNLSLSNTAEIHVDRKLLILSLDGEVAQQVQQATGAQSGAAGELAAAADAPTKDPRKLKVAELRSELQSRRLDTSGLKPALVKRLSDAMDADGTGGSKCFRVMSVGGLAVGSVDSYNSALRACTGTVAAVGLIEVRFSLTLELPFIELIPSSLFLSRCLGALRMQSVLKSTTVSSSLTMPLGFRIAQGKSPGLP